MLMRALTFLNVAILSALVASAGLLYAQDEKPQDDKPARQEEPKPQPKPDEAKPAHQDDAKPAKQDNKQEKQDQKRDQDQSRDQMKPEGQDHPEQQQAAHAGPAGKGGHIPDDKFKANFGRGHHFSARGVIVQGQSQFQYGGYTFQFVDAWPAGWAYTDDCYIDYIDGEYFLFDLLHPGVQIALVVNL
jgi:hypothetical protein